MSYTTLIDSKDTIGNSLSTVNINYSSIDYTIDLVKQRASKYWIPMYNYYLSFRNFLKNATTIAQTISSTLDSVSTTVELNSSAWIKPIVIFYPTIFPPTYTEDIIQMMLTDWLNHKFPISQNKDGFVEGQKAMIYAHSWKLGDIIHQTSTILDYTECKTGYITATVLCKQTLKGVTYCSIDTEIKCEGIKLSCNKSATVRCHYSSPIYSTDLPTVDVIEIPNAIYSNPISNATTELDRNGYFSIQERIDEIKRGNKLYSESNMKLFKASSQNGLSDYTPPSTEAYGAISATVEVNYEGRQENRYITCAVFVIKNCKWEFSHYSTTPVELNT